MSQLRKCCDSKRLNLNTSPYIGTNPSSSMSLSSNPWLSFGFSPVRSKKELKVINVTTFWYEDLYWSRERVWRLAGVVAGVRGRRPRDGQRRPHLRTRLHRDPEPRVSVWAALVVVDHPLLQVPVEIPGRQQIFIDQYFRKNFALDILDKDIFFKSAALLREKSEIKCLPAAGACTIKLIGFVITAIFQ